MTRTKHPILAFAALLLAVLAGLAPAQTTAPTLEQRLAAIEQAQAATAARVAFVERRVAAPDAVVLDALQGAKLEPGRRHLLTPGAYTVTSTVVVPAGATLDATGSTVTFDSPTKYASPINIAGSNVTIRGGTWYAANATPADPKKPDADTVANSQRVVAIDQAAADVLVEGLTLGDSPDGKRDWGAGYIGYGTTRTTIRGVKATRVYAYLAWNQGGTDFTVDGNTVTIGSTNESVLRFHSTTRLVVRNNDITSSLFKVGALRCHDGADTLVEGNRFVGIVTIGPMGGGDGGEQWGRSWWVGRRLNARGQAELYDTTDKSKADLVATAARRVAELAKRLNNVTLRNNDIAGYLAVDAGITGVAVIEGGRLATLPGYTKPNDTQSQPFNRLNGWYPTTKGGNRLPGDVFREPSRVVFRRVAIEGAYNAADIRTRIPAEFTVEGCTYNGVAIPDGPGWLTNW